jgi:uncharacterized membrane protein
MPGSANERIFPFDEKGCHCGASFARLDTKTNLNPTVNGKLGSILKVFAGYLVLNVGTFLMLKLVVQYLSLDDHVGFLEQKQAYLHIKVWKFAFYVHVFSSVLTLLAGFTQFSAEILRKHPRLHRTLGRIYAWDILAINFPAGVVMAVYANGHLPSKIAFLILDSLWFWFTLKAITEIKRGHVQAHRDYMMRSYALTLSALTLRTWKILLTNTTNLSQETIYMMDAWLGFVPNLLCAEWLILSRQARCSSAAKKPQAGNHQDGHRIRAETKCKSNNPAEDGPQQSALCQGHEGFSPQSERADKR